MGNVDDDSATFEQGYDCANNRNEKVSTPISNGHIPSHAFVQQEVEGQLNEAELDEEEQNEELLLLNKHLKFSAPAYTEIRTRSGGLKFKVS